MRSGTRRFPDGMVWNMRYLRDPDRTRSRLRVTEAELWDRLAWFLAELVPVAEEAGVRLAAHPDDPPVETPARDGAAREPAGEIRPAARACAKPRQRPRILHRLAAGNAGLRHL